MDEAAVIRKAFDSHTAHITNPMLYSYKGPKKLKAGANAGL
jgi:hypothetical protein